MVVGRDTDKIFMVMEYMEHDIKMLMEAMGERYFDVAEVKCLMKQLLSAIHYMHGASLFVVYLLFLLWYLYHTQCLLSR